eukprot:UN18397
MKHGFRISCLLVGRLQRHLAYYWEVLQFFSGNNFHSQLFFITFCNLNYLQNPKVPKHSKSIPRCSQHF